MLKASWERDGFPSNWSRSCNSCQVSPCTIYCHSDSAYLCKSCDECIHAANPLALHHERVWVCSACESAPATITCHADAANLCINCDTEIHLANPLASRHNRVPASPPPAIVPTSSAYLDKPQADLPGTETEALINKDIEELDKDEANSWLLLELDDNDNQTNSGFTYGEDVDENLDLIELSSFAAYQFQDQSNQPRLSSVHEADNGSDSVVPVQPFESKDQENHHKQQNVFADSGCEASKAAFTTSASSSHKVPLNSGYLLTTSNTPNPYARFPNGTNDILPGSSLLMPVQFSGTYREARVLRYREKRKSRKFEKKIRYATRKANAETRPRVKGRFARKTDMEFEVDQTFTAEDYDYGIVPSYKANKRMKLVHFF